MVPVNLGCMWVRWKKGDLPRLGRRFVVGIKDADLLFFPFIKLSGVLDTAGSLGAGIQGSSGLCLRVGSLPAVGVAWGSRGGPSSSRIRPAPGGHLHLLPPLDTSCSWRPEVREHVHSQPLSGLAQARLLSAWCWQPRCSEGQQGTSVGPGPAPPSIPTQPGATKDLLRLFRVLSVRRDPSHHVGPLRSW